MLLYESASLLLLSSPLAVSIHEESPTKHPNRDHDQQHIAEDEHFFLLASTWSVLHCTKSISKKICHLYLLLLLWTMIKAKTDRFLQLDPSIDSNVVAFALQRETSRQTVLRFHNTARKRVKQTSSVTCNIRTTNMTNCSFIFCSLLRIETVIDVSFARRNRQWTQVLFADETSKNLLHFLGYCTSSSEVVKSI